MSDSAGWLQELLNALPSDAVADDPPSTLGIMNPAKLFAAQESVPSPAELTAVGR